MSKNSLTDRKGRALAPEKEGEGGGEGRTREWGGGRQRGSDFDLISKLFSPSLSHPWKASLLF